MESILRQLDGMAERLELSSTQALLIYAASNGWITLNQQKTIENLNIAFNSLVKIAEKREISLDEEDSFVETLRKQGVFLPNEQRLLFPGIDVEEEGSESNGSKAGETSETKQPRKLRKRPTPGKRRATDVGGRNGDGGKGDGSDPPASESTEQTTGGEVV